MRACYLISFLFLGLFVPMHYGVAQAPELPTIDLDIKPEDTREQIREKVRNAKENITIEQKQQMLNRIIYDLNSFTEEDRRMLLDRELRRKERKKKRAARKALRRQYDASISRLDSSIAKSSDEMSRKKFDWWDDFVKDIR